MANELVLFKESITDEGTRHPFNDDCSGTFYVKLGQDVPDMRDLHNYSCAGNYSLTLEGPSNTTVTLFANISNGIDRGYLVLRKTDDRKVWVIYLDSFEPDKWTHVDSEDKRYGNYDVYYDEGWNFERRISSIKWGEWWVGILPSSKNKTAN